MTGEVNGGGGFDLTTTKKQLSSSSSSSRVAFLHSLQNRLANTDIEEQHFPLLLNILFSTYSYYLDRASRQAVQRCIRTIFSTSPKIETLAGFVKAIQAEAAKPGLAPGSAFVLVEWCSVILQESAGTVYWDKWGLDVIAADAQVLELCLGTSSRTNVKHSALVVTRRALRKVFSQDALRKKSIEEIIQKLTSKTAQPTAKNAVMLGVVAGVAARDQKCRPILSDHKTHYYTYYVREIIGSRIPLPQHIANGLYDFFIAFSSDEDVNTQLAPSLEKGLLRAPEVVLNDLLTPLLHSLPSVIDRSKILRKNLLKHLLANTKSSNAAVRQGVVSSFKAAASGCRDEALTAEVASEISIPLAAGKVPAADQRSLYFEMLGLLPVSLQIAQKVLPSLAVASGKETNDAALTAATASLVKYLTWSIQNGLDIDKPVTDVMTKGLADKKVPVRRLWAQRVGELLWELEEADFDTPALVKVADSTMPSYIQLWNEVVSNPLAAAQSGLVSAAFVFTAMLPTKLALLKNNKTIASSNVDHMLEQALVFEPKPSFLLNHRVYSKLNSQDEILWFSRALFAVASKIVNFSAESPIALAWSQAVIFCSCSKSTKPTVKRQSLETLTITYTQYPSQISAIILQGIWQWRHSVDSAEKDTPAAVSRIEVPDLYPIVKAICPSSEEAAKLGRSIDRHSQRQQLVHMLVLCRPQLLPNVNWIELCLRVKVDPGELVKEHAEDLMRQIVRYTDIEEKTGAEQTAIVRSAAYQAVAELAFVSPELMTPRIINMMQRDLDPSQLADVGPIEAGILRTPEGTPFVDVLAKKPAAQVSTKSKDYDTLKWEEELRTQLAQKKGQQRKLTAEETSKVNAQLSKEIAVRTEMRKLESRLRRGLGIVTSLAHGPPTDAESWMGPVISLLIKLLEAGAGLIVGDTASQAYIACSERVSSRVGPLRPFIGIATLRALNVAYISPELLQEPLESLVTRVLYRLRFAGEQRKFDTVSLIYILPLIFIILRKGGFGGEEDADSQVVLALEFLTFHTEACYDPLVPRESILSDLIAAMQRYNQHYKLIKDCLADLCRCIAPNITEKEIKILSRGAIVPQVSVRSSVLQSISAEIDMSDAAFSEEIWLACHDDADENVETAREIWEESDFMVGPESVFTVLPYLESSEKQLRRAAARSLADAIRDQPHVFDDVVSRLKSSYSELAKPKVSQLDEYGMPRKTDLADPWEARHGIALGFKELAPVFEENKIESFLRFLIEQGPLSDRSAAVRDEMVDAATALVTIHGEANLEQLMNMFEQTLVTVDKSSQAGDMVNEAVIILYGALGRHLKQGDARVPQVVDRLLETLSTPSETVQYAVAECLPPLVRASGPKTSEYVQRTLDQLFTAKKYAARRGAAYGLAGLVHGRGIVALREYRIMSTLQGGAENKKDVNQREGALIAFELLSTILGRLFEPYVIQIVPQLLSSFGDSNADVRDACLAAAKACFASLSSYGVKQILPTLLDGLDDQQWRSKKGACDLLGAMAYLDPQQLAQSLPVIIPPLTAVLNDSHKEVRLAANRNLKRFGEVINNPEIKSLVDILLKALSDPTKYTDDALDALIKVSFVHYLDAPSLALVVRILERGLGDRSATKRKSAQVIGSLSHLTERKDLVAHLPILVAGLKTAIVDPVPTTRATASKALGSLIEKLGEDALPDLIPGLMQTLKSDSGAGDRLGSAQALSEVLAGLGTSRLEETLPTILQNVTSSKPAVREGFMSLFIFLPVCFGNSFANYLGRIIPPILAGLADDVESIRETSLRAARLLVKNFATRAIDLLLPELERGLADDSYRIRLSSVELVGDLLFNLTGITANKDEEEDEEAAQEAGASLLEVLGEEKRNRVLSSLYICRCDTSGLVRSAAVNVWKVLVASPRTLKELIPTLTQVIIRRLGSSNMEQKVIAGNALGELIRKAGDGVLSTLLPTLEDGLQTSTDSDFKQGICMALRELISSASPEALEDHEKTLIAVVRTALTDSDEDVREAAAEAFDSLQQIIGKRAVDHVLPHLLNLLRDDSEANNALSALLTLLTDNTRANIILPNLIPTLLTSPINSFNAKALASLATVAGASMTRRLPSIFLSLMDNIISCKDDGLKADLEASFDAVLVSIDPYDGLNTAMNVMFGLVKHDDHRKRAAADYRLAKFFASTEIDYSSYNQDIIRSLLMSFSDGDSNVVKAAWTALNEFTKRLKKEEMEALVPSTRQIVLQVGVAGHPLAGFGLPKGINAILPIFLQGLMGGTSEQKIQSALAISDIIDRTSSDSLKAFVTQITGPLIRVVTEKSVDVKAAVLVALNNLLEKIPTFLKPFLPQLQRTFAKALADPSSELLRTRAAKALGTLITITPRIDPLIGDLVTGSRTSDIGVRTAMLKALFEVISKAGANMNDSSRNAVLSLIDTDSDNNDVNMAITNARLLGALIKNVPTETASPLIKNRVMTTHMSSSSVLALNAVLLDAPNVLIDGSFFEELPELLCQGIGNKNPYISDNCVLATGKYLLSELPKPYESTKPIFESLAAVINPGNPVDTRRLALVVVRTICRLQMDLIKPHVPILTTPIFSSVRDPVIPVKLAAEAAFVALFDVVEHESKVFDKFMAGPGAGLPANTKRSMQDYFKRVALRLGAQARERKEAEGGQGGLGLSSDEAEDEREINSVGKVDLGEALFSSD